jgi:hypothetical protein
MATPRSAAVLLLLLTLACGDKKPLLEGEDVVLATVEGKHITKYDLESAAARTLGHLGDVALSGGSKRELVEGMALGRAMASLRERELDDKQKAELDKRVQAFRERLLVDQYLAAHGKRKPPAEAELKAYYDANPAKFGQRQTRVFELAFAPLSEGDAARVQTLASLGKVREAIDWDRAVTEGKQVAPSLALVRGDVELGTLPAKLRTIATSMAKGEASAITFVDGRAYVLRVTQIETVPPWPFADVRDQIAVLLAPRGDKQAVLAVRDDVLKRVKVDYTDPAPNARTRE